MGLGGGTWLTQNKVLPGAYINFVALHRANATLSDRGIATVPLIMDWGVQGEVIEVSARDFQRNSKRIFGYDFTHRNLRPLRELFHNISVGYFYRLGVGGTRATNAYATARFVGNRGNDITVSIAPNVDTPTYWDVTTHLDNSIVDIQTVFDASNLMPNDYVTWNTNVQLTSEAGVILTGGESPDAQNSDYQIYLDKIEGYSFNAIGCPSNDTGVKGLFTAFTKRMRDDQGAKFQLVSYDNPADFEGVINIYNPVIDDDAEEQDLVWWVTGVAAGTPVNRTATNSVYNGEYQIKTDYTQMQLERAIGGGRFALYRNTSFDIRVLSDINSLVNVTLEKNEDFKYNQTIRVIDQIANDIAVLFNTRYLGIVPNDEDGRVGLWSDIVQHHEQMQTIRAIQDFDPADVTVEQGNSKRAVLVNGKITPTNAMSFLYMTVSVA